MHKFASLPIAERIRIRKLYRKLRTEQGYSRKTAHRFALGSILRMSQALKSKPFGTEVTGGNYGGWPKP